MVEQRMVAFLRGINLGRRRLKMDELRGHFEAMGYDDVATYLASGNVILDVASRDLAAVEADIETGLEARLGYDVDTFVRTLPELAPLSELAPLLELAPLPELAVEEESKTAGFKPHVIFLKELVDDAAARSLAALETPDDAFHSLGREVIWLRRGGLSDSPISHGELERALGRRTTTMRTANTVRRIVAKFGVE